MDTYVIVHGSSPSSVPMYFIGGDRVTQKWSADRSLAKGFTSRGDAVNVSEDLLKTHSGKKKVGLLPHRIEVLEEDEAAADGDR